MEIFVVNNNNIYTYKVVYWTVEPLESFIVQAAGLSDFNLKWLRIYFPFVVIFVKSLLLAPTTFSSQ